MSPVEEIKSRLDLVDIIGGYLKLQKSGSSLKTNCPFHGEKTASFYVSPAKQIWHCFGCGKGGDMFKFVMEIEGHDFPEVLRLLAERAGVVLKREDPHIRSERNRLYEISEYAARAFEAVLQKTPIALAYLKKRGITDETIKRFRIGFAPRNWDFLLRALQQKGFNREDITKTGLLVESEDRARVYDRFRSRIMFPIADANERVIGFGGRIFEEGLDASGNTGAKYINTPATAIYDKSRVLYGLDKAKLEIRKQNAAVIVEGYMDCVMSHQAGVAHTIAVSGTALTPFQLTALKRLTSTLICSFDADGAGENATKRSLSLAAEYDFERKIAAIPSGKDPADAVLENPDEWIRAVADAKPIIEFFFEKAFRTENANTPEGKKTISNLLLPYIAELSDTIQRAHWVNQLAARMRVPESTIWTELQKSAARFHVSSDRYLPVSPKSPQEEDPTRRMLLEERFLALLTQFEPEKRASLLTGRVIAFSSDLHRQFFTHLTDANTNGSLAPSTLSAFEVLQLKGELLRDMTEDLEVELALSAREIEQCEVRDSLEDVSRAIKDKEHAGAHNEILPLLERSRELMKRLLELSR